MWLPYALAKKYPSAHRELRWQYVFASSRHSKDPRTGRLHRHHLSSETFAKHLRRAVEGAGLIKHVTSHTFRHCFASHLLWGGTDIRRIQELLGHSDIKTTMIYTHVKNVREVVSPLDQLITPPSKSEDVIPAVQTEVIDKTERMEAAREDSDADVRVDFLPKETNRIPGDGWFGRLAKSTNRLWGGA